MNGAHDLGGMHGFGSVEIEKDEPVFHFQWEKRMFALTLASGFHGKWNLDMSRYTREQMPPAEYLATTYYEHWLFGLQKSLVEQELITASELRTGHAPRVPGRDRGTSLVVVDPAGRDQPLMAIEWDADARQFHLHNDRISYVIGIHENGALGGLYFGPALAAGRSYRHLAPTPFGGFTNRLGDPVALEYPTTGGGDSGTPASAAFETCAVRRSVTRPPLLLARIASHRGRA